MLQRSEDADAIARPELVPAALTSEDAVRVLAAGRPAGAPSRVVVDGVACPVVSAGTGRPVVFVHGLGHDQWDWAPLFARRPSHLRYVALDLPGFGFADKPDRDGAITLLVDAVLAVLDEVRAPAVLVGSSLGGHVAMLAALRAPRRVAGLFLLDPGGLVDAPVAVQQAARAYYSFDAIRARPESEIVGNSRRIFSVPCDASDRLAARKLAVHRSPLRDDFARPFARVVDDVFRWPVAARLDELRVPTTFVQGIHDVVVPAAVVEAAAARLRAPYRGLATGHCPHLESVDQTMDVLLPFVEDVQAGKELPDVPR
jgi:pimeloyl-ACP methyl ester carboxylesterase